MATNSDKVAQIVANAGGTIVGKTKLQKIAYILERANFSSGFKFSYYHYGPYSEELSNATKDAVALSKISEDTKLAEWGGKYSIFSTDVDAEENIDETQKKLIEKMLKANSVALELAATTLFLYETDGSEAWDKTVELKPEKATPEMLVVAKTLYSELSDISENLPNFQ